MLNKMMALAFTLVLFGLIAVPSAFANNDMLNFSTNAPIELPGRVIPAGKYQIFDVTPNNSVPIVEVLNAKTDKPVGLFPLQDVNGSPHNLIKLQKERNSVDRLSEFFVPGTNMGYKFQYPHQKPLA